MRLMRILKATKLALAALAFASVVGCQTTNTSEPVAQIEVFRGDSKPEKPYSEITSLTDDGAEAEQSEIEAKMIKKAQKMGGNAIIFAEPKQSGFEATPFTFSAKMTYLYKGTVIKYQGTGP